MKKRTILFVFTALLLISSNLTAQHFQTVWSGNPYQPMTFIVNSVTIDNVNCAAGDEIAVFDVDGNGIEICVGVVVLAGEILPGSPAIITTSTDDPLTSVQDGFIDGHTIIYRIWDSSESEEITMIQATYNTSPPFVSVFSSFGTAIVELEGSSSIRTTAGSLTGCPGNFTVPVDVENMQDVTDFTLTLNYTPAELTYTSYQNVNAGLSGGTLTVTSSSGEVQMTWTSATAVTIGTGTLLELIFNAPVVYTQTLSDLIWDISGTNCQYLNAGTILPAEFIDGIITIEPYPQAAGTITGSTGVCQGTTGEPYQIDPIVNATSYVWELTPTTAGTINGSGTSITIDWSITYNGQATLSVYGSNNCGNGTSSSLNVQVQALPEAVAGSDVQICENATYQLNGVATDYSSILWTTSGDGSFDDATLLNATYTPGANDITNATVTLTLTAYPIAPCTNNATDQMTITFAPLPTSDAGVNDTICENSTCQLSGAATNESGVLWTTSGDGNFSNNTILNPIYTPGTNDITNGSAILTLTAYATAPCTDDATDNMTLTIISLPITNAGPDDDVCEDNPAYTLSGTASNQSSILWTTAGDGTFDDATLLNATYTPGANDITTGSVALTITAYPITPCSNNATDVMTLNIIHLPTANAGQDANICENNTYTLNGTASNYSSILWTTSGDGTFDDATILNATYTVGSQDITNGTVDLTLTANAIGPCTNATDVITITIQPLPTANAGSDDTICENQTYTLSGSAIDYNSILWSSAGDGTFDNATIFNATYTPGANDITNGSVILTLTAYPLAPCAVNATDDMILTIQWLPTANAGADDIICENQTYTLSGSATDYNSILWTTGGDGAFNDATILNAIYTPGANDITNGSVILTITAYPVTPCAVNATDDMILSIQWLPTANAGANDTICENQTYTLSGSAIDYSSILWTTLGDGIFDDPTILNATYTPGTNDITNGYSDLVITAYPNYPCTDEANDTMTLYIEYLPIVDAGDDATICEDDAYALSGTASNYSSVLWTSSGDGTFTDPTNLTTTYTPGPTDITNGSCILTLTAYPIVPCADSISDDMTLTIQGLPTSNAGDDATICEDQTYTLSGTATNQNNVYWITSGDGSFDDPTILNPIYTPGPEDISSGSVDLTMYAYAISPCGGEVYDVMTLSINLLPTANAGEDNSICENESYTLSGSAENYLSILWTTAGDGTFDDPEILNATYTPGTIDIQNGEVILTLTASPNPPCTGDATDEMTLSIDYLISQVLTPDGPIEVDIHITPITEYTTQSQYADNYVWVINPSSAGIITGTDTIGTVTWNSDFQGNAYIKVTASNNCNSITSDSLDVFAYNSVGITECPDNDIQVNIIPNPSAGHFKIIINGFFDNIDLQIINSNGTLIEHEKLINTGTPVYTKEFDFSSKPVGVYFLKFINNKTNCVEKIIIR